MQRLHLRREAGGVQGVLVARHMSAHCHMRVWGGIARPYLACVRRVCVGVQVQRAGTARGTGTERCTRTWCVITIPSRSVPERRSAYGTLQPPINTRWVRKRRMHLHANGRMGGCSGAIAARALGSWGGRGALCATHGGSST